MEYSEKIARQVRNCLDKMNSYYDFFEELGFFKVIYDMEICKFKKLVVLLDVREDSVIISAVPPFSVSVDDDSVMRRITEYMCRINYEETLGGFSLNFKNGEINCFERG